MEKLSVNGVLGKTTYNELIKKYGQPFNEGTSIANSKMIKTITYAEVNFEEKPRIENITANRALAFYLADDILVGYEFISSYKTDSTYFEESQALQLAKGQTKEQVKAIMGEPKSHYIYPVSGTPGGEAYGYMYAETQGFKARHRQLMIAFDPNGRVENIVYRSQDQK